MADRPAPLIRRATPGDLRDLLAVYEDGRLTAPSPMEQATWDLMMDNTWLTVYCAQVGGGVVGTATLLVMPNLAYHCAPTAFVEAVVVLPEYRRLGIASAMLTVLLEDANRQGCNKVQLMSHKRHAQDGAYDLYTNLGFEAEAEGFRTYLGPVPEQVLAARGQARLRGQGSAIKR